MALARGYCMPPPFRRGLCATPMQYPFQRVLYATPMHPPFQRLFHAATMLLMIYSRLYQGDPKIFVALTFELRNLFYS